MTSRRGGAGPQEVRSLGEAGRDRRRHREPPPRPPGPRVSAGGVRGACGRCSPPAAVVPRAGVGTGRERERHRGVARGGPVPAPRHCRPSRGAGPVCAARADFPGWHRTRGQSPNRLLGERKAAGAAGPGEVRPARCGRGWHGPGSPVRNGAGRLGAERGPGHSGAGGAGGICGAASSGLSHAACSSSRPPARSGARLGASPVGGGMTAPWVPV